MGWETKKLLPHFSVPLELALMYNEMNAHLTSKVTAEQIQHVSKNGWQSWITDHIKKKIVTVRK